jgi:alpha-beta hydrolase superfamily lysophospholipase
MSSSSASSREPVAPTAPSASVPGQRTGPGRWARRLVGTLLIVTSLVTLVYTSLSIYVATQLADQPPIAPQATPASLGLAYRDVTFPSREDHLRLSGWFIPGVLPDGTLTSKRAIIMVHGYHTNRADPAAGLLDLSAQFARNGFAVLSFDLRGDGKSAAAPLSLGEFEQRDVLGAVDFLRSGPVPYAELGRPQQIAGFGESMGAASLLLAAAREPAIQAIVSDTAYATSAPDLERDLPKASHLPAFFTPGTILAANVLYGVNLYAGRPIDVVAQIAPRPIFFIHVAGDNGTRASDMTALVAAAKATPNAHVQSWLIPGGGHSQGFHIEGAEFVRRIVAFFTTWLGPAS